MIDEVEALAIASQAFPKGPEAIAERLGAFVNFGHLSGCEGWFYQNVDRVVIRINSASSSQRQRFTLAHELAHVIQGTVPNAAGTSPFESNAAEERAADRLASQILLPEDRVVAIVQGHLPIDASTLNRLGRAANVSGITAACRVVSMATGLGLQNAAVAFFNANDEYQWRYSEGLTFPDSLATSLMQQAMQTRTPGTPLRIAKTDGNVIAASILDAFQYKALFLQLLPPEIANNQSAGERLRELRSALFNGDGSFENTVAGCVAYIAREHSSKTVSEALVEFDNNYMDRDTLTSAQKERLGSAEGREFLRLRLATKCRPG